MEVDSGMGGKRDLVFCWRIFFSRWCLIVPDSAGPGNSNITFIPAIFSPSGGSQ